MTLLSNKAIVARFNTEFFEEDNMEMSKEIVANDFIHHTGESAVSNHAEGLKQFMTMLHAGLSDI